MTTTKHTPTPWNTAGRWAVQARFGMHFDLYKSEYTIEQLDEVEANAAFIVRAVNAHDELVALLEEAIFQLSHERPHAERENYIGMVERALCKARGEA